MAHSSFSAVVKNFEGGPADLIPVLQRAQEIYGFLSEETIRRIARWLKVSENEIYGVATFFAQFRFTRPGDHEIKVCLGTACHVRGGEQILEVLKRRLEIEPGEATPDGKYQLERVACLGCCALAPVVTIDGRTHAQISVLKIQGLLDERGDGDHA